ncbi:MAG: hypothetical protein JWN14_1157 [Chthonomonadales bacterium]|nr:hypothetical protein [Chthonomonadales bacterium]
MEQAACCAWDPEPRKRIDSRALVENYGRKEFCCQGEVDKKMAALRNIMRSGGVNRNAGTV